ncbi:hypothetical protein F899_01653 [Acinetobacter sp. CIP 101934]|nr:hypothetical protein F899_01653 [Acinetobacter sp. CIP 101934]
MGSCFFCIFFITLIANYFEIKIYHDSLWGIIKTFTILFFLPMYVAYKAMFIFGYIKEQSEINIYSETFWGILVITQWIPATMGWVCANNLYKEIKNKSAEQTYHEQPQYYYAPQPAVVNESPVQEKITTQQNKENKPTTKKLICEPKKVNHSTSGLDFYGSLKYAITNTTSNLETRLKWGVTSNQPYAISDSYTGSIRARLFAFPESFTGSTNSNGYQIGEYYPNFSGTVKSTNQLYANTYVSGIISYNQKPSIPSGSYCIVAFLEEYNEYSCSHHDKYCVAAWLQFENAETF